MEVQVKTCRAASARRLIQDTMMIEVFYKENSRTNRVPYTSVPSIGHIASGQ